MRRIVHAISRLWTAENGTKGTCVYVVVASDCPEGAGDGVGWGVRLAGRQVGIGRCCVVSRGWCGV